MGTVKGYWIPTLPRVPTVILHRVDIKGLLLPRLGVSSGAPSVGKPCDPCSHSAVVERPRASGRFRKTPRRSLFNSAETQTVVSKLTAPAGDKVKLAINGCQVIQNSPASDSSTPVAIAATQQGDRNILIQDKHSPLSPRVQEDTCKSAGDKDSSRPVQHTEIHSPPTTRQSSATKREVQSKPGELRGEVSRGSGRKVRAKTRRKRVVSAAFLDSLDDVSDVDTSKEEVGPRKRKRRGTRTAASEKPPTRKRRLSSSGDEVHMYICACLK